MPNALMIHPGECNGAERMVAKTGKPIEKRTRTAAALGFRVAQHLGEQRKALGTAGSAVEISPMGYRPDERFIRVGSTAVVLIDGPIWYDHSGFAWWGGMSTIDLANTFDDIAADDTITGCLLDMDSPGGTVAGIDDLITAITALSAAKPTATFIHEMGASLAYWLASCTKTIYGTPSSVSGAIGAMSVWHDTTAAAEKMGEKAILFTSGAPQKGKGSWGVPFTEEMMACEQAIIDSMGVMFRTAVTEHRGITEEAILAMGGATYFGQAQIDQGLVDELVSTVDLYDRVLDGTLFTAKTESKSTQSELKTTPAAPAARAAAATERRTAMDDTLKDQITAMTPEEKEEVFAMVKPDDEEKTAEEIEEEKVAAAEEEEKAKAAAAAADDESKAMTIGQAKAFLAGYDFDEHTVNALAIDAVEKKQDRVALLQSALKAQKDVDPEIARQAQGNEPIGGGRGGGGGGGGGDAVAKYHAAVKETMETHQLSRAKATAKVNREQPEIGDAFVAASNVGRVG